METDVMRLQIRFEKNGFIYWQICRTDQAAIYEQRMPDGRRVFYEVWRIRVNPSRFFGGRQYPAQERRPSTQDWGRFGWTYYSLQDARKKYDELNGRGILPDAGKGSKNDYQLPTEGNDRVTGVTIHKC